jgi:toxin ParE1/3/4
MKAVVFNPVAVADLDEITQYVAKANPEAAHDVRQDILDSAERLGNHPGMGIRPRFRAPRFAGIRYLPADRYPVYLLFYRELGDGVEVLRVLHGNRDLPRLLD